LGLPPGVRRTLVSHVDFAPTLLDLLDLPALPGAQGASYAPVLRGAERADAFVLVQTELSSALRRGSLKLLRRSSGSVELFDLRHDPGERRNLAALGCLGECAALHAELLSRIRALGPPRLPRSGTLTDEKAAALGALGYL
jgi:arylsulfatase A-like enzyme